MTPGCPAAKLVCHSYLQPTALVSSGLEDLLEYRRLAWVMASYNEFNITLVCNSLVVGSKNIMVLVKML